MNLKLPYFADTPTVKVFSAVFALGAIFYLTWNILYGKWTDVGVYAVTVILCGFGLVGMFHYSNMARLEEEQRRERDL